MNRSNNNNNNKNIKWRCYYYYFWQWCNETTFGTFGYCFGFFSLYYHSFNCRRRQWRQRIDWLIKSARNVTEFICSKCSKEWKIIFPNNKKIIIEFLFVIISGSVLLLRFLFWPNFYGFCLSVCLLWFLMKILLFSLHSFVFHFIRKIIMMMMINCIVRDFIFIQEFFLWWW